jgi:hypothetical protein
MRLHTVLIGLAIITATSTSFTNRALAQASVNENESVSLYVNAASGSNSNSGTQSNPFATIQAGINAAVAQNKKGLGVKVLVEPGTYREAVTINALSTSAALTLQAVTAGTAYIDGADVLSDWSASGNGVYTAPWDDSVTGCALPSGWYSGMPPVVLANEMLFVNGAMMTQVMSAGQLQPGTFYVNTSTKQIEVDPPQGTEVSTAQIEVASRRSTLTINDAHNVVVRGLVLEHGASCMNTTAATVNSATNILFDSDVVQWNNWSGLGVSSSTDITVSNTIADYNGGVGIAGFRDLQGLWNNNETSYNNWRGAMVGLYDFGQGGTKLMHVHGGTVTGQASYNNQAQGLWFDTDNINISISGADLIGNLVGNLQLELSQGPISVENSSICSGSGVQILESDGITMTGNHFYNNGGTSFQNAQLFIAGKAGGRTVTNWQTNVTTNLITKNMKLSGNSFTALGTSQYLTNTYLSGSDWSDFADSLSSNDNEWYNSSNTVDFGVPANKKVSFSGWKSEMGQDVNSTWALSSEASADCTAPKPSYPDFQMLAHNAASYIASYSMSAGVVSIPLQIRSFGYGSVSLSVYGLPSGVTSSFSPSSLTSGSSVLTLTATSSAAKKTVPVTIFATSGSRVHSITVEVAVTPK